MMTLRSMIIMSCSFGIFLYTTMLSILRDSNFIDEVFLTFTNYVASPFVLDVMAVITFIGKGEVIFLLMILSGGLLLWKRDWYNSLFLVWVTIGGVVLNFLLKLLFQRERPGEMSYIEVFGQTLEIASYSFPSGHTMRTALLFSFFIYITRMYIHKSSLRIFSYLLCFTIIVGVFLSRIILGAHYPTDIIAAISISILWFFFSLEFLPLLLKKTGFGRIHDKETEWESKR